jgi:FKBP-type peptidyl-prolyl cis-trans isomerase
VPQIKKIQEGEKMTMVKEGDTVRVHYTGRLEDGTVFDTSEDGASMEFKVGEGELLKAFEGSDRWLLERKDDTDTRGRGIRPA